jgi:hypothetical protein
VVTRSSQGRFQATWVPKLARVAPYRSRNRTGGWFRTAGTEAGQKSEHASYGARVGTTILSGRGAVDFVQ